MGFFYIIFLRTIAFIIRKAVERLPSHTYQGLGILFKMAKARSEITGLENLPSNGPFIIAMNHMGSWGVILIVARLYCHLHRVIHTITEEEVWQALGQEVAESWSGLIPRGRFALKKSFSLLKQGEIVALPITGQRDRLNNGFLLNKAEIGVGILSSRAKVIPVGFIAPHSWDWFQGLQGLIKVFLFGQKIKIKVGQPICFPEEKEISRDIAIQRADRVLQEVSSLIAQLYSEKI